MHTLRAALLVLSFPGIASALPLPQTLRPVADARVSESRPDTPYGSDEVLRVRGQAGGSYRSLLRFDNDGIGVVTSARLRLYCTDGSPDGGIVYAMRDTGWDEYDVTWADHHSPRAVQVAWFNAVEAGGWVEVDITLAVRLGARVFGIASSSSNSAYYSSREGAHPPELVVNVSSPVDAPVADFEAAPLSGLAPLQTSFSDLSSGAVSSWLWEFGDGQVSSEENPVHVYGATGTYSVSLSVAGPGGSSTALREGFVRVLAASSGIWSSPAEVASLPTSGAAWNSLLSEANRSTGTPNVSDQDDDTDVRVLAKALVYARTGTESYRQEVVQACVRAIGTEAGGRTLALGRNLIGYVLAADLVTLPPAEDAAFRVWLRQCLTESLSGKTLVSTHEERPNNWGTHAGASRVAVAVYLGDQDEVSRCAQVFKGWLGDRSSYAGFDYGDLSWQADSSRPVGINPRGATRDGHSIDGVLADDQRRAGGFTWPPPKENYVWEALQGALAQAVILDRAGYAVWSWEDEALLRAVEWLHEDCGYPASGDDTWQPHVVNHFYSGEFPAPVPSSPGKNVGWTDWTLAPR